MTVETDSSLNASQEMDDAKRGENLLPWNVNFGNFPTILAIAGAASIAFSYVYDFGFFFRLGVSFSVAPTTIVDHLQSWLVWLPFVFTLCVLILLLHLAIGATIPDSPHAAESENCSNSSFKTPFLRVLLYTLVGIAGIVAGVFSEFTHALVIGVIAAYAWVVLISFLYVRHGTSRYRLTRLVLVLAVLPPIVCLAAGLGYQNAHLKMQENESTHRVHKVVAGNESDVAFEDVRIVRVFEKWMLFLDDEDNVVWLNLNQVARLAALV